MNPPDTLCRGCDVPRLPWRGEMNMSNVLSPTAALTREALEVALANLRRLYGFRFCGRCGRRFDVDAEGVRIDQ